MKNIKEIQHAIIEAGDAARDGLNTRTGIGDPIIRTAFEAVVNITPMVLEMIEEGLDWNAKAEIIEMTYDVDTIAKIPGVQSLLSRDRKADIAMNKALHYLWEAAYYVK